MLGSSEASTTLATSRPRLAHLASCLSCFVVNCCVLLWLVFSLVLFVVLLCPAEVSWFSFLLYVHTVYMYTVLWF